MKTIAVVSLAVLVLFIGAGSVSAQGAAGPPKPGPEHEKLAYYVGTGVSEGEMKPSAFGPGGKFTFTEKCDWFDGKFALICNSEMQMRGDFRQGSEHHEL